MNSRSIESRAARVSLVSAASTVLQVALQLVSVPICMVYWGQSTYGTWLTILAAFTMARSLDTGYVAYVSNKINYLYHVDQAALRAHLASGVFGTLLIGGVQLALSLALTWSERLAGLLGLSTLAGVSFEDRLGLVVLIGSWVLSGCYLGIVHRLLIPAGMMYQASWWSMAFQVSQFIALIAAAIGDLTVFQTSILWSAIQAVVYVSSAVYIARMLPGFYPWWRGGRPRLAMRDLADSAALMASGLVQQATGSGVVLLVASLGSAAAVPVFTTVRTLANLWTTLSNTVTAPLLPDVVRFHATGEPHKLRIAVQTHWVLIGTAINAGILLAYPMLPELYAVWTRSVPLNHALLAFLLGSIVVANAGALISLHLNGINSLGIVLLTSILRFAVTLGIAGLGYRSLGLAAFGLGALASEVAVIALTYGFFSRHLKEQGGKERLAAWPAATGALAVLLFLACDLGQVVARTWSLPLALAGVALSGLWGWSQLPHDVRARLARVFMLGRQLPVGTHKPR